MARRHHHAQPGVSSRLPLLPELLLQPASEAWQALVAEARLALVAEERLALVAEERLALVAEERLALALGALLALVVLVRQAPTAKHCLDLDAQLRQ